MSSMRALVLLVLVAALIGLVWARPTPVATPELPPRLGYVATARQLGVVGYRDPVGAISPNGRSIAYSEGRDIRIVPLAGGSPASLARGEGQIRHLAWIDDTELVAEDTGAGNRWWKYSLGSTDARAPLWPALAELGAGQAEGRVAVRANDLRQLAVSADGRWIAGLAASKEGPELWRISRDGSQALHTRLQGRPSWPTFTPSGEVACITTAEGRPRISLPCGEASLQTDPAVDAVGPVAFSPDAATIYFASPGEQGMVDLWSVERSTRRARRLTSFKRDTYAPSVAADGTVLFKLQSYRTFVADVAAGGGPTRQLATFQSETPSWHPTDPLIAVTFGTWRRVLDDAKYPDIAQEIGVIRVSDTGPAAEPQSIVAQSNSEDQAMAWSPNGKWIALHSHREMSDDVWLRPADGSSPDRRITFLGRGAEVGWPRWSPDGQFVLLDGADKQSGRSVIYVIGVNQDSGELTSELREVKAESFDGELTHAEWLPNGKGVVALAKERPGRHAIVSLPITGGRTRFVHRYASEHDFSGLGISPDGRMVAFVAPAVDGHHQIFRVPFAGGPPVQITSGPSEKSQPAWSPDGSRIAFTVWSYEAAFWTLK
jgi:Tol biopolymer transport system component